MFIILLVIAPTLCEWVEISQHHVRKPTRTYNIRPIDKETEDYFEDTTRATRIYLNQSLTERPPWSRGNINKVPKLGNVQRVQLDDSPIKAPSLNVNPVRKTMSGGGGTNTVHKNNIKESVSSANSDSIENKRHKSAQNERYRTTNKLGTPNIKKVNWEPTEVVSNIKEIFQESTRKDEGSKSKTSSSNQNNNPSNDLDRASFNRLKTRYTNIDDVIVPATQKKANVTQRPQIFGYDLQNRHSLVATNVETTNKRNDIGEFLPANADKKSEVKITNLEKVYNQKNKHAQNVHLDTNDEIPKRGNKEAHQSSIIRNKLTNDEFVTKIEKPIDDDMDVTVSDDNEDSIISNSSEPADQNSGDENSKQEEESQASSYNEVNSIENLMTFMKVVAETIRKNTRRSVSSKTKYLTNLKNSILENIAERIETAWPDDEPTKRSRMTRAAHASSRGHLEIPSSESALMTISFLTFAVFLIKLVLLSGNKKYISKS